MTPREEIVQAINLLSRHTVKHRPWERPTVTSQVITNVADWKFQALLDGHRRSNAANPGSFSAVSNAFRLYADYSSGTLSLWTNLIAAIGPAAATGTRDVFIDYLVFRYVRSETNTSAELAVPMLGVVDRIQTSGYHPVFRFIATYRSATFVKHADGKALRSFLPTLIQQNLEDAAKDTNMPASELHGSISMWMDFSNSSEWSAWVMEDLEDLLDANWAGSAAFLELKGRGEISKAWKARGTGSIDTVTDQGTKEFRQHLAKAQEHLEAAWSMDASMRRVAREMMTVELGQGLGLKREQLWFDRVMAISTNDYNACLGMAVYLEPRWYGSDAKAIEFGRLCVASQKWGAEVPLVLQEVHHNLAQYYGLADSDDYWHRPQVWRDVRSSYEKFFQLNPGNTDYNQEYARDAFKCGQYTVFLQQLPKFTLGTNYSVFKGEEEFNRMVAEAKAKAAK